MLLGLISLSFVALLPARSNSASPPQSKPRMQPPPGMVFVAGGPTLIGSTVKYVEREAAENELNFKPLAYETPQHEVAIDDFFLMVSEVTNEQYEAFVEATGARPPQSWAWRAIDEARARYVKEIGALKAKALDEGRPIPSLPEFDAAAWWAVNWRGKPWAINADEVTAPVVYVDYSDVVHYARWAGLRPMTEFEFQRAGRRQTDNAYPWGNTPDPARIVTMDLVVDGRKVQPDRPFPVASFPTNATPEGIYDLCGNAWEWTSSPFAPYPGYRDLQIEIGAGKQRRKVDAISNWNPEQKVVVGGCFQTSELVARLTTRRRTDLLQATDSMGFRCAASITPGLDLARAVLEDLVAPRAHPAGVRFDPARTVAAQRWRWKPGTATVKATNDKGEPYDAPLPNYAVITGYDHLAFVPAVDIDTVTVAGLKQISRDVGVAHLGVLSLTRPAIAPALPAGVYLLAYRASGAPAIEISVEPDSPKLGDKSRHKGRSLMSERVPKATSGIEPRAGLAADVDELIFFRPDGEPVASIPAPELDMLKAIEPSIALTSSVRKAGARGADGKPLEVEQQVTVATLRLNSWVKAASKALVWTLALEFKASDVTTDWRHP